MLKWIRKWPTARNHCRNATNNMSVQFNTDELIIITHGVFPTCHFNHSKFIGSQQQYVQNSKYKN